MFYKHSTSYNNVWILYWNYFKPTKNIQFYIKMQNFNTVKSDLLYIIVLLLIGRLFIADQPVNFPHYEFEISLILTASIWDGIKNVFYFLVLFFISSMHFFFCFMSKEATKRPKIFKTCFAKNTMCKLVSVSILRHYSNNELKKKEIKKSINNNNV